MTHLEIRMYTARKRITYSKHLPQFIDSRTEMTLITEVIDGQRLLLNWIELWQRTSVRILLGKNVDTIHLDCIDQ